MADTTTTNYGLVKPELKSDNWGGKINSDLDAIDAQMKVNATSAAAAQSTADSKTTLSAAEASALALYVKKDGTVNPTNLLSNGDFEAWSAGASAAPDGWSLSGAGASVAQEGTIKKLGSYSVKITRSGASTVLINTGYGTPERGIAYWKGRVVTFGCWVYATVDARARIAIGDGVGISYSTYHTGDSTWKWLTVTHTISASAANLSANIFISAGDTTIYADGAMFVEGSSAFAFSPKPINEGANSSTVPLTIAGNVGIGTTAPTKSLDVRGTGVYSAGANGVENFKMGDTTNGTTAVLKIDNTSLIVSADGTNHSLTLTAAGDIYTNAWADYSATSTIVGWASFTTKQIYTMKIGKRVKGTVYISGVSNATTVSFTVPYTSAAAPVIYNFWSRTYDANNPTATPGLCTIAQGAVTFNCYKDTAAGAFTNSGTKTVQFNFEYQEA